MIKQPEELNAIKAAIDLTTQSFMLVHESISSYTYEYEVEAAYTHAFKRAGRGHAYTPIVASGKNSCTLHYIANSGKISPESLLLLDVGAEVENYAADISRTYAVQAPTARQKSVFRAVKEVQEYAFSLLKPGVTLGEYESKIEAAMVEKLQELRVITKDETDEVRNYYPHASSHFLGLDVHDVGDYQCPLEPGMVLTVEPGIYLPEENIGIRIEDNVLVTPSGIDILSKKLPRKL